MVSVIIGRARCVIKLSLVAHRVAPDLRFGLMKIALLWLKASSAYWLKAHSGIH